MSEAPSEIGSYVVLATMPPDESGAVYLVREDGKTGLDELRTLLHLSPSLSADASFKARFVEHARRCKMADGDVALVPVEIGEHDGRPFVVHRYVHGVTLRQLLAGLQVNDRRLLPEVACAILLHVANGLDEVHDTPDERGQPLELVHGGISADRLILAFDGRICLTGFGVLRDLTRPPPTGDARMADMRRYAAPEVLLGDEADTRADVYSIGVLLWEAIADRRFEASAKAAGQGPRSFAADCPTALDIVVQQCISDDPDRRPITLDELSHLLTLGVQVANRVKLDAVGRVASVLVTPELERGRIKLPADVAKRFDQARPQLDPSALDALTLPVMPGTPRDFMDDLNKWWARPANALRVSAPPPRATKDRPSTRPAQIADHKRPHDAVIADEVPLIIETTNVRVSIPPPIPPPRNSVPPPVPPPRTSVPPPLPPNVAEKAAAFAKDASKAIPTAAVPAEASLFGAKAEGPTSAESKLEPKPLAPAKAPLGPSSTSSAARAIGAAPLPKAPLPAAKPPLSSGTTSAAARALPAAKAPLPAAKAPLSSGTTSAGARALPAAKVAAPAKAVVPAKVAAPAPKRTLMGVGLGGDGPEATDAGAAPAASPVAVPTPAKSPITPSVAKAATPAKSPITPPVAKAATPAKPLVEAATAATEEAAPTSTEAITPPAAAAQAPAEAPTPHEVAEAPSVASPASPASPAIAAPAPQAVQVAPTLAAGAYVQKPVSFPPPPARPASLPPPAPGAVETPFGTAPSMADPFGLGAALKPPSAPLSVDSDWGTDDESGAAPLDAASLDPKAKSAPSAAALLGAAPPAQAPAASAPKATESQEGSTKGRGIVPAAIGLVFVLGAAAAAYFFVFRGGTPAAPAVVESESTPPALGTESGSAPTVVAAAPEVGAAVAATAQTDAGVEATVDAGFDAGIDAATEQVAEVEPEPTPEPEAETTASSSSSSRSSRRSSSSSSSSSSSRTASTTSSMTTPPPPTMTAPPPTMTTAPAMEEESLSFRERRAARRAARRGD